MNIFVFIKAVFLGVVDFFRAYDPVVKMEDGYPLLKGWGKSDNIYHKLYSTVHRKSEYTSICALLFDKSDRNQNLILLGVGEYKIGNTCHSDIVITSKDPIRYTITLKVEAHQTTLDCTDEKTRSSVNGISGGCYDLIEQDQCQFNDISFSYLRP